MAVLQWEYEGETYIEGWPDDSPILPVGSIIIRKNSALKVIEIIAFLYSEPDNRVDIHIMCKYIGDQGDFFTQGVYKVPKWN